MKRYITTTILTLFLALTTVNAQNGFPTITVHLKDGSKVTRYLKDSSDMSIYGMNDEKDDDYVICEAELSTANPGEMTVACQLTPTALDKKVGTACELIISLNPFDENVDDYNTLNGSAESKNLSLGQIVKATKIHESTVVVNGTTFDQPSMFAYNITGLRAGTKLYLRANIKSEDNHYSTIKEITVAEGTLIAPGKYVVLQNIDDFVTENQAICGANTTVLYQIVKEYWIDILKQSSNLDAELALADKVSDNSLGKDYIFNSPTHADEIIEKIKANAVNNMYIKASPETLAPYTSSKDELGTSGAGTNLSDYAEMVQCDPKWEIPDNEYMILRNSTVSGVPNPAFNINGIMLPGKTYNVTITLAPQTDETDTAMLPYFFNVYLAEGNGTDMINDTYPRLTTKNMVVNPTDPEGKSTDFTAPADQITSFTVPFTPTKLVNCHGIKLCHNVSSFSSSNRKKYCQVPRIIGISVTLKN